jgi:uncharacterized membrane protein
MTAALLSAPPPPEPRAAAIALGIALGGFFDGIVLHQVLQWHHLLSAVDAPGLADPAAQVMVDGLFHAAMYVLGGIAAWRLLRAPLRPAARRLGGWLLVGFAAWHLIDSVLSHWLLGIHRIRMDVASPLAWDLGWLVVFGGVPALLGAALLRRGAMPLVPDGRRGTALGWVLLAAVPGGIAARPPGAAVAGTVGTVAAPGPDLRTVTVILASASRAPRLLAALPADGRVLDTGSGGRLWRIALPRDASTWPLVRSGAIWVAGTPATPGCASWSASEP